MLVYMSSFYPARITSFEVHRECLFSPSFSSGCMVKLGCVFARIH